jgi:hypothetical protein
LLSLPYDVRYIIYSHLFPSLRQLYLMASRESIHPMMRPGSLNMEIFLTCRQLHLEASGYLYNNYLFNIIGYKKYCMAHYRPINLLVERYARSWTTVFSLPPLVSPFMPKAVASKQCYRFDREA